MNLRFFRAGYLTTVQDAGRRGFRDAGVSLSGAADVFALRVANLVVGNDDFAAGIEFTHGKIEMQCDDDRLISWCGGDYDVAVGGFPLKAGHAALVTSSDKVEVTGPRAGARGWLAISGGIDVPMVLGSRSTDLRTKFGGFKGRALRDGDELALGQPRFMIPGELRSERLSKWYAPHPWISTFGRRPQLRCVPDAGASLFGTDANARFRSCAFSVSAQSDRMGVRLTGCKLERDESGDLVSEAVAPGTIQVPPTGDPVILLNDCQTIGGYPKIAHVISVDMQSTAQLREGDEVAFREVTLSEAEALTAERARDLQLFRVGIQMHFE